MTRSARLAGTGTGTGSGGTGRLAAWHGQQGVHVTSRTDLLRWYRGIIACQVTWEWISITASRPQRAGAVVGNRR